MRRQNAGRGLLFVSGGAAIVGMVFLAGGPVLGDEVAGSDGAEGERRSSVVQRPARERAKGEPSHGHAMRATFPLEFRTIDGTGNNGANPTWGAAGIELLRLTPVGYADGASAPAGATRESARAVSNVLSAQAVNMPNRWGASDYLWQWGQFLDHDIDETPVTSPGEAFDIEVPIGDPWFDPEEDGGTIPMDRSAFVMVEGVRQQLNNITAFIDASNVYGSEEARAEALRTNDGTGRLKTSAGGLLPYNTGGHDNAPTSADPTYFLAGDIRANEQIGLTAMHTLWVREHNRWAGIIAADHPTFDGDEIYEHARAMVAAEMQAITFNEFLPVLLGPGAIPAYAGYQPSVNPGIANVFATAAYRVGHTMLSSTIRRLSPDGTVAPEGHIALLNGFFNPSEIEDNNIDSILRGLASQPAQTIDCLVIDDIRNFLFGAPGSGGFDLASLNVQRGRDHGLASYNEIRVAFGRAAALSFADVHPEPAVQNSLASVYATPDDVDAWIGLLAEPPRPGSLVGETLHRVLVDQFTRLRDGDRFWYQSYLPGPLVNVVEQTRLSDVIRLNTNIGPELPENVFRVPVPPACLADLDGSGIVDVFDFNMFATAWATGDLIADLSGDNVVDVFDFNIFASQFGDACE